MIKSLLHFLWCRDSNSAGCLCIHLGEYMDRMNLRDIGHYFLELSKQK